MKNFSLNQLSTNNRALCIVNSALNCACKSLKSILVIALLLLLSSNLWGATDKITAANLAATTTTYTDFSNVSISGGSSAVYAGSSAKTSNGGIQIRSKNSNSGIISTTSGGTLASVTIEVESGSNQIDIYGSNTAYTSVADLFSSSSATQGTKLGSLTESGTINVTGSYAYVGVRSYSGALYLTSVTITWGSSCSAPTSPTNGSTGSRTQDVSWTDDSGSKWDVYCSTSNTTPTTQTPTAAGLTSKSYQFTGLEPNTTYYWWVRTSCGETSKSSWVAGNSFKTSAVPTLSVPSNLSASSITKNSATLTWDAVTNKSSYTIKIGDTEYTNISTNSYNATGLTPTTTYTWTVKAIGDGENYQSSAYATTQEFTTSAITWTDYLTECSSDPTISVSKSSLSDFSYIVGYGPSVAQSFKVSGTNLKANVSVSAPTNYEISTSEGGDYTTNPIILNQSDETLAETTIYVRLKSGLAVAQDPYTGNISITSTDAQTKSISLSGSVIARVLNSIEIKTQPTTTTYTLGQAFNPAGLVITAKWNSGDEDVSYNDHSGDFTFTDGATTALTAEMSTIKVYYGGQSADISLTLNCSIQWLVNGDEYTTGSPATSVALGGTVSAPATAPSIECGGKVFVGWKAGDDYEHATDAPAGMFTTTSATINDNTTFRAVFATRNQSGTGDFVLVTTAPQDWSGKYLIVEQTLAKCFDGSLTTLDAVGNFQSVTYENEETKTAISHTDALENYMVTISQGTTSGTYYVKTASGYYIGSTGSATTNELLSSTETKYSNTISINGTDVSINGTNTTFKFYYDNASAYRFRYFKSSASNVRCPKLYRFDSSISTTNYSTKCAKLYEITSITVDPAGYGSVDKSSVENIPANSAVTTNANTFTVNGTTVTATPTEATAQYTYAFSSWSNLPATITADVDNVTANFTRTLNNYDVTPELTNVSVSGTAFPAQLPYGGSFTTKISANAGYDLPAEISVSGATPSWDSSTGDLTISEVTGAVTVTITGVIKQYAVTLAKNEDWGTINPASLSNVNYGTAISIDGSDSKILHVGTSTITATPAANTAQYTYGWTGWSWEPAGATITEATTATASFTRTLNQYTITFKNEDETVLQSSDWDYGATPIYSGETPTKPSTAQFTYTFNTWDPTITTVTEAATYHATFTPATRVYNIGATLTNVIASPAIPATIEYGGGFSTIITANPNYLLPENIMVTGAEKNWNAATGALTISNVTGPVSITIEAELSGYKTLYLKPNSNWKIANAKYALYDITHSKFINEYMTAVGCETDIYSGEVPSSCAKVIYVRLDPTGDISWGSKWNQTGDLDLDGVNDLYTITENSENWSAGSWSKFNATKFTITFNKNNGEGDDVPSITNIGCGGSAILPANNLTRTGYDANGWNTAADGSGTHYDDGETIADITANIPLYAQWTSNDPGTVTISGTYHYWEGETITLTATAANPLKPSATYTWKRNGVVLDGQTSATLTIASCTFGDAGTYTCTILNGGASSTSAGYGVKMLKFWLKDAAGQDISEHLLTKPAEGTVCTLALQLDNENTTYKFCIVDGAGGTYGNTGQMTNVNSTDWPMNSGTDCRILTSGAGNYTFSIDYANIGQPKVSVTYPNHDQAAGNPIYFDNSQGWSADKLYYRIGASTTLCSEPMTLVPGTSRLYTTTTKEYHSFLAWHIGNNAGWTGSNSIYKTKTGDDYAITNSTAFIKTVIGETGITIIPTSDHSTGMTEDNNNCEFYSYNTSAGLLTHTATVTTPSHGTITLSWTDITGTAQSATATTANLAHTCNLTITATPATGYELTSLTVNGEAFTNGQVYMLDADATIAATFSTATYTVDLQANGGTINEGKITSYTYGEGATLPTNVTKDNGGDDPDFGGWFAESDFSGERVYIIGTSETGDKTFYALWTYLFGYDLNGGEYSTTCDPYITVPEGTEMTVTTGTPTKTGYQFTGWKNNNAGALISGGSNITINQTTLLVAQYDAQQVNYTVNHYKQNVDGTYPTTPTDVDNLQAATGSQVTPDRKDYGTGFTTPDAQQVTIAGDGSTVVTYKYARTTHTITWTLDDGFDTQWYQQTGARYGATPNAPSSDPQTGNCDYEREFVGWVTSKITWEARTQTAPSGMFVTADRPTVSDDATYYAVFAQNDGVGNYSDYATACVKKYTVTEFSDANGNSITANYEQAAAGETVTLTVTPASANWTLQSMSVVKTSSQSTLVEVTNNQFTMPAYDVTVKATFVPCFYVHYHVPSGECITAPTDLKLLTGQTIADAGGLSAPTGTIPGGWTFAGWSTEQVLTESTTMPLLQRTDVYLESDIDVYALYQKAGTETLTFDQFLSGSTYNSAYFVISSVYSSAEHALPNTTIINGSDHIASTTITSVLDGMVTNATEIAATKMLFRKISSTEVQILNVNNMFLDGKDGKLKLSTTAATWTKGGSGTQANPVRFTINSKALRINSSNEYGHYAAAATQVNDTKVLAIANNTVYYLTDADCVEKWMVTYDANDGETTCDSGKKVAEGFTICADAPTRDHYTFDGWSDGVKTYAAGAAYTLTKDVTFVAQWNLVQHTVTFKNNGETLTEGGTRQVGWNTAVGTLPHLAEDDAVGCNGRSVTFMGWIEGEIDPRTAGEPDPALQYITSETVITEEKIFNAVWAEGVEEEVEP